MDGLRRLDRWKPICITTTLPDVYASAIHFSSCLDIISNLYCSNCLRSLTNAPFLSCPLLTLQAIVKAHELRSKSKNELLKELDELKQELASLRVQKISGGAASKLTRMWVSSVTFLHSLIPSALRSASQLHESSQSSTKHSDRSSAFSTRTKSTHPLTSARSRRELFVAVSQSTRRVSRR